MSAQRPSSFIVRLLCGVIAAAVLVPAIDHAAAGAQGPTAKDARAFIERAEATLADAAVRAERANWVQSTYLTSDTEILAAQAEEALIKRTSELATEAARFARVQLPPDLARKLMLLRLQLTLPAPADAARRAELTRIAASLEGDYGRGKYCRQTRGGREECLDITAIERITAESRDPRELLDLWVNWRKIAPPMRDRYARLVQLTNEGARELRFADAGALWRSNYDMPPDRFAAEVERLWQQVRPFYQSLHAYVRRRLSEHYGPAVVPPTGPIPAHVLGNPWAQQWSDIYTLVAPPGNARGIELSERLRARQVDARGMVRFGEQFFTSLGFKTLPATFWERSLFVKPADREVVCHASAWNIDTVDDVRLKMCIQVRDEDFRVVHHELGHTFYQLAYNQQPYLFKGGANDAFHEAIGDTIALSITPEYLQRIGIVDTVPPAGDDIGLLLRQALDKIAFLPFGLLIDQWRWKVFAGEIAPAQYNAAWWEMRGRYQGLVAPVPRSEADFDPGAKYHVPAHVPYTRYFLAHILQFQFHRALCQAAGQSGPLHRCSIYGNQAAGERLQKTLALGMSRPWPEALEVMTEQREIDATAINDYFAPLIAWLDEQNKGQQVGW
ncbi:MAG TPA: M2 family metallopeptidase [Gemmatimonadales bacterium]|nr:M2 family metallopeptidase [Gemmatimonadales bacterium]